MTPASLRMDAWYGFRTRTVMERVSAMGWLIRWVRIEPPLGKLVI
jgi:hypothetical protein